IVRATLRTNIVRIRIRTADIARWRRQPPEILIGAGLGCSGCLVCSVFAAAIRSAIDKQRRYRINDAGSALTAGLGIVYSCFLDILLLEYNESCSMCDSRNEWRCS